MAAHTNMNSKTMKAPLFLSVLAFAAIGCGGDIQQLCFIQRPGLGGYAIVFTATGAATGTCTASDNAALADTIGDIMTMDKFRQDQSQLGIRPGSLLNIAPPADPTDPTSLPTIIRPTPASLALGDFSQTAPAADNTCTVSTVTAVTGEGTGSRFSGIQMSNIKFLTGSLYQGSQVEMDATYTLNACSRTYHGIGLTPLTGCDPADQHACDPVGDPVAGIPASGINPSYPVSCSTEVGALFPVRYAGATPSVRSAGGPVCWFTGNTFPQLK